MVAVTNPMSYPSLREYDPACFPDFESGPDEYSICLPRDQPHLLGLAERALSGPWVYEDMLDRYGKGMVGVALLDNEAMAALASVIYQEAVVVPRMQADDDPSLARIAVCLAAIDRFGYTLVRPRFGKYRPSLALPVMESMVLQDAELVLSVQPPHYLTDIAMLTLNRGKEEEAGPHSWRKQTPLPIGIVAGGKDVGILAYANPGLDQNLADLSMWHRGHIVRCDVEQYLQFCHAQGYRPDGWTAASISLMAEMIPLIYPFQYERKRHSRVRKAIQLLCDRLS